MSRPLEKLLAAILGSRRRDPVLVVVQTERGQVTMPVETLRDRLRRS